MVKHGLQDCIVPYENLFSDKIIDEVLSGKRALLESLSSYKVTLPELVRKKRCGFYISESEANYKPHSMLFNKNFNKELKDKIDLK